MKIEEKNIIELLKNINSLIENELLIKPITLNIDATDLMVSYFGKSKENILDYMAAFNVLLNKGEEKKYQDDMPLLFNLDEELCIYLSSNMSKWYEFIRPNIENLLSASNVTFLPTIANSVKREHFELCYKENFPKFWELKFSKFSESLLNEINTPSMLDLNLKDNV